MDVQQRAVLNAARIEGLLTGSPFLQDFAIPNLETRVLSDLSRPSLSLNLFLFLKGLEYIHTMHMESIRRYGGKRPLTPIERKHRSTAEYHKQAMRLTVMCRKESLEQVLGA